LLSFDTYFGVYYYYFFKSAYNLRSNQLITSFLGTKKPLTPKSKEQTVNVRGTTLFKIYGLTHGSHLMSDTVISYPYNVRTRLRLLRVHLASHRSIHFLLTYLITPPETLLKAIKKLLILILDFNMNIVFNYT